MEKQKHKFNAVDVVIILIVVALIAFAVYQFLSPNEDVVETNGTLTLEVLVSPQPQEMYEDIMKNVPAQLVASNELVDGRVVSAVFEEVEVTSMENAPVTYETDRVYGTILFTIELQADLNDLSTGVGNQEIRTGRSYIVKTQYYEITGTILSVERTPNA